MDELAKLGPKVKALRRQRAMTQHKLAEVLGISTSYLNLIENNRRPLTAPLLIKLARHFGVDLQSFAPDDASRLSSALMEVLGDAMFDEHRLTAADVQELVHQSPGAARAMLTLYGAYRAAQESLEAVAGEVGAESGEEPTPGSRLPSEEVSDLLQDHLNHFPALEDAADALWRDARIHPDLMQRDLVRYLEESCGVQLRVVKSGLDPAAVRRYDPSSRVLVLSELLAPRSRTFQMAHQIGLLRHSDAIEQVISSAHLTTTESRALARVALANYFAAAVLMPYRRFLEAAREERYDVELLGHRFRASYEQVCHRLTSLRRPGEEGVPFHLTRVDIAGNISKRFSASGIKFARFSGACPRWGLFAAFQTPGMLRLQVSQMTDGAYYFCVSRTLDKTRGGYHAPRATQAISLGCRLEHAKQLVYADHLNLDNLDIAVPIGVTCRLCERKHCAERAFPSLRSPLHVDENVRGLSFYAGADELRRL
jgi:predicted transcriptional regulator/transcriptional regulator with XRE-family HTH domain